MRKSTECSNRGAALSLMLFFVLLSCTLTASEVHTQTVQLQNGEKLLIKQIQPSRILPHAFHDQAVSSIPGVYPDSQIIAKRRIGYLGKNPATLYSMVCYKESIDQLEITISGVVIHGDFAWSYDAKVAESSFADSLLLIMESLADLPSNNSLQPGRGSGG